MSLYFCDVIQWELCVAVLKTRCLKSLTTWKLLVTEKTLHKSTLSRSDCRICFRVGCCCVMWMHLYCFPSVASCRLHSVKIGINKQRYTNMVLKAARHSRKRDKWAREATEASWMHPRPALPSGIFLPFSRLHLLRDCSHEWHVKI